MMKYKWYSSKQLYQDHNRILALKDFFGKELYNHFEEPMFVTLPSEVPVPENAVKNADFPTGTSRSDISIMYIATKEDYKVDYETAMTMYKEFHDKAYKMREQSGVPIVWYATGLNRSTMYDAIPMLVYQELLQKQMNAHSSFKSKIADYEKLLDGCWLTSPMPTIMKTRPTMEGPKFTYTFGKRVPEKNRLVFQLYVVTHDDDYMV